MSMKASHVVLAGMMLTLALASAASAVTYTVIADPTGATASLCTAGTGADWGVGGAPSDGSCWVAIATDGPGGSFGTFTGISECDNDPLIPGCFHF